MDVSKNGGTPISSILIGFSIINHPFWGYPYFWKHPYDHTGLFDTLIYFQVLHWCLRVDAEARNTQDLLDFTCRKFCYLLCFNKKLRWELATHLWEELQVHPSHLLSCDRSCDRICAPKRAPFSKGLEATSMSYAAVVGCLGWFLPLNR